MRDALKDVPQKALVAPKGVTKTYVNPKSGGTMPKNSKGGVWEFFDDQVKPKAIIVTPTVKTVVKPKPAAESTQLRQKIESLF